MNDVLQLCGIFALWKSLILLVSSLSPGLGYDTSTTLLSTNSKLTRWDGIYYVSKARQGDIFEQEWAFGKGLSTVLGLTAQYDIDTTITAGIVLSHVSHLIAVLLLWKIASLLNTGFQGNARFSQALPFVTACLHIISPAGVFLSAPYSEAPFAAVNMFGFWLYLEARLEGSQRSSLGRSGLIVMSGLAFGCATVLRSNGILSGLPFLFDASQLAWSIVHQFSRGQIAFSRVLQVMATVIAGCCIAVGLLWPQYLAYQEYCTASQPRSWCDQRLPLIYSFVQSHYWGVGFLRYWTVSNLPLFLLATPVLLALLASSYDAIKFATLYAPPSTASLLLDRLAMPQLVLAILAITNYHIQIITRLSSGYPWLYVWLAQKVCKNTTHGKIAVGFSVMYTLIQAGLYASFLPPA